MNTLQHNGITYSYQLVKTNVPSISVRVSHGDSFMGQLFVNHKRAFATLQLQSSSQSVDYDSVAPDAASMVKFVVDSATGLVKQQQSS